MIVTLFQDCPDRVKAELSRLGVRFTLFPTYDVPQGQQPYLRAVGEGDFEALVGRRAISAYRLLSPPTPTA